MIMTSKHTIERLILYRKILKTLHGYGILNTFSHKIANLAENTSAQVRRDLMAVGYTGSPAHGYEVTQLEKSISEYLDSEFGQKAAIVGLGKLGRAILDYSRHYNPKISVVSAFDIDEQKIGKDFNGCKCYNLKEIEHVVIQDDITVAILTLPSPDDAQIISEQLVKNGVRGILNYTSAKLKLEPKIYVENRDMMVALEKVAYFAKIFKNE